jgi:two-component system sensor histidine kinase BarA
VSERQFSAYNLMSQLIGADYRHDLSMLVDHPVSQQLQALRAEIKQKVDRSESLSVSQEAWFSLTTERINLLQSFEHKLFMDFMHTVQETAQHHNRLLWVNSLLAVALLGIMLYFWFYVLRKHFVQPLASICSQLIDIIGSARYQYRIQGAMQGEFAVMRDSINEALGRLEEAVALLEKDKVLAERLNEAKSTFVHHITHELRTPLNAILGFTQLLQMEQETCIKGDPLDQISMAARHLLNIINQVLDMAKVEAGKLDIEHIPYSIHDVVHLVVNMTRETAKQKGLLLSSHLSPDLPDQLLGDPTRMRQVLINLVGNAIKFTEFGSVTVTVDKQSNDHLRVVVEDTGIGMTESAQKKLFQPFTQADESISRHFGGTGLGLSLSKELVES